MHDVGKIAVPDAILNKPGKLTAEEFEVMKGHTIQGAKLLEQIPQLRENGAYPYAWDIARHHHERWDGRGVPRRAEGGGNLPGGPGGVPGRRLRCPQLQAGVQGRLPPGKGAGNDPGRGLRGLQSRLLECFFQVEEELAKFYHKPGKEE